MGIGSRSLQTYLKLSNPGKYVLLRSSWTNKLITAKDHRSVQINVGHLDEIGLFTGSFSTFAMCGQVRDRVR